jgi:hypothetical protein
MVTSSVRISAKAKRVTLQRWLLARVLYDTEEFGLPDLCCLFENQIWLERKVQTDSEFHLKFGKPLEDLSVLLKEINFRMEFTNRALLRFRDRLKILEGFILPRRNYVSLRPQMKGLFSLEPSTPLGKSMKSIPPAARIGIGYRDKGSARDLAHDGSPRWQEVAAHRGPIYKDGKPYEEIQVSRTPSKATQLLEIIGKPGGSKSSRLISRPSEET